MDTGGVETLLKNTSTSILRQILSKQSEKRHNTMTEVSTNLPFWIFLNLHLEWLNINFSPRKTYINKSFKALLEKNNKQVWYWEPNMDGFWNKSMGNLLFMWI